MNAEISHQYNDGDFGLSERRYFPELDGLRAVAVWIVVCDHVGIPILPGSYGVVLFFVLSGFLITLLLMREHERQGRIDFKAFYIRRTLRIMPAFYCYIAFATLWKMVRHHPVDVRSLLAASTYTINYVSAFRGDPDTGYSHAWSLAVEEQFYLLWPMLFTAMVLRPKRLRLIAGVILSIWCIRVGLRVFTELPQSYFYAAFEMRFDSLLVGVLMAFAISPQQGIARWLAVQKYQSVIVASVVVAITALAMGENTFGVAYRDTVTAALLPPLCALLILSTLIMGTRGSLVGLNAKPVVWLGLLSYSTYLYQGMVVGLGQRLLPQFPKAAQLLFQAGCLLVLAMISYYAVERPALHLRRRFTKVNQ